MASFEITDHRLDKKIQVSAPGVIEAIHEYLDGPSKDVSVLFCPSVGVSAICDKKTGFKYSVKLL